MYVKLTRRSNRKFLMSVQASTTGAPLRHDHRQPADREALDRQSLLETEDAKTRLERLYELMQAEIEILQ